MQARINYLAVAPGAYKAMLGVEEYLHQSGLEKSLLHLIKLRASQINACAYCIDMHWKDLRSIGENEERLYGLDAWRESPYYTDAGAPHWRGLKRSPISERDIHPMRFRSRFGSIFPRKSWQT
jgi:AhpD family alkylhydroperoxidase